MFARGPPEKVITKRFLADVFEIEATVLETEYGLQVIPIDPITDAQAPHTTAVPEDAPDQNGKG